MSRSVAALEELEARLSGGGADPVSVDRFEIGGFEVVQSRNEELAATAVAARRLERWKANLKKALPSRT